MKSVPRIQGKHSRDVWAARMDEDGFRVLCSWLFEESQMSRMTVLERFGVQCECGQSRRVAEIQIGGELAHVCCYSPVSVPILSWGWVG